MATLLFDRRLGSYRLSVEDDGSTHLEHDSIPHRGRLTWFIPELIVRIAGVKVEQRYYWSVSDARDDALHLVQMETEHTGLLVHVLLGYHPIHRVPTRHIVVRNISGKSIADLEVEIGFRMPTNSEFVVLTSSDRIRMLPSEKPGTELDVIGTAPLPVFLCPSLDPTVRTAQVNSLLLPCGRGKRAGAVTPAWQSLLDKHYPGTSSDQVLVDGYPAYWLKESMLEPEHAFAVTAPHFLLRTTRDTAGISGIGFVVYRDDMAGALACINAPTHLASTKGTVEQLLGLYSPIAFYDTVTTADVLACAQRLQQETGVSLVYVVLPDADADKTFETALVEALTECHVVVFDSGTKPEVFPVLLHLEVLRVLAAAAFQEPVLPQQLVVTPFVLDPTTLADAQLPHSLLCLSENPALIAYLIHKYHLKEVLFAQPLADALVQEVLAIARHYQFDCTGVSFRSIDRMTTTNQLAGAAARQAANRCVANATVSVFQVNNIGLIDQLFAQMAESLRLWNPELAALAKQVQAERNIDQLGSVVEVLPDLAVRSVAYSMCGPCALVVSVLTPQRWHDAIIAAQFARAKQLPVVFVTIENAARVFAKAQLSAIDTIALTEATELKPDPVRRAAVCKQLTDIVVGIGWQWLSAVDQFSLKHLARKSLIIFDAGLDLPWELASWPLRGAEQFQDLALLAQQFDISRMTAAQSGHVGRFVHRTFRESLAPPTANNRVLLIWDTAIDSFMGGLLESQARELLAAGFEVHVVAPAARLKSLQKHVPNNATFVADACTRASVLAYLGNGAYSVIVAVLHGVRQADGDIALAVNQEFISRAELPELQSHPVVVLNSCWASQTTNTDAQEVLGGLAMQCIERGAFQIIAPRFPVSALGAKWITNLILRYGWTRSAARVLRGVRQAVRFAEPELIPYLELDTLWYMSYGDPTASKMFELDGIWEVEDAVAKLGKLVPVLEPFLDNPTQARHSIELTRAMVQQGAHIARIWAYRAIDQLQRYATSVKLPLLTNSLSEQITQVLERIDEMVQTSEKLQAELLALLESGKLKSLYNSGSSGTTEP